MSLKIESENYDKQPCVFSAKGVGVVIPNLMNFPQSIVIFDIMSEGFNDVIFQIDKNM